MVNRVINPVEVGPASSIYSKGIRHGNTVRVSGQISVDQNGNSFGAGDIAKQSEQVFRNMASVLDAAGASFDDVVSTTTYMTNPLFRIPVNEARQRYGLVDKTNTSLIVPSLAQPEFLLEVEAVAVVDTEKQVFNPSSVHDATGRYSHAIKAGETIYIAGQIALDPDGNLVGPGDIEAQAEQAFRNMGEVLKSAGAGWDDVVNTTTFMIHPLYRSAISEARRRYGLVDKTNTSIVIPSLALPEFLLEVEAVAVVGAEKQVFNPSTIHDATGRYSHAIKAGETIYIAGQIALGPDGNLVGPGDIEAQAEQIYWNMGEVLREAGASFDNVVNTTTYLTNPMYREAINSARQRYGAGRATNTSLIVPSLPRPEFLAEVEAIAVINSAGS